ncbi:MFS general substrate transporter [Zopfia rhizophila CBS 207.26]|uniref:MFS general substrate transporter n=1 Tax=Zopfia rhizophila CBS 207.26 TaxID=1314779 RepID=A0A6A6DDU6_9PEZI|nr:MFS general substrate transporter [Zopfia rhizophila CBS 207.26]
MASQEIHKETGVRIEDANNPPRLKAPQVEATEDAEPVPLSWRTWLVVFVAGFFAIFTQIFTSTAAPSVIAFIVQDLGHPGLSGWVIQAPLLMQAVLNPIIGRLSDVLDRKMLVTIPPLLAFAGSVISARANDINMLIAGSVLLGVTLATIGVVQSIPAEVLPLKYRAISNGISFLGGAIGAAIAALAAGAFSREPGGWRNMFWLQAALHVVSPISLFVCYWPPKNREYPIMKLNDAIRACDPIGSILYVGGATLLLMALNWSSGTYAWSDPHVAAPFGIGLGFLMLFGIYEWKGRSDGLCAHVFFQSGRNFSLSVFAMTVEGWMFYSAVNTITVQMPFYLEWQTDSLLIFVRQLSYVFPTILTSTFVIWYSTKFKDIKIPLVVCFCLFLVVTCTYAATKPDWGNVQLGLNVLAGIGQAGPLTLLLVATQFSAPHAYLSTATGLAFSARAVGGAFGSAVLYAIINGHVSSQYNETVRKAALNAGLSPDGIPVLLGVLMEGNGPPTKQLLTAVLSKALPGIQSPVIEAAQKAAHQVYARAYQLAWASIIPFVVIAIVCCGLLTDVREMMTEKVEAPVEKVPSKLEE